MVKMLLLLQHRCNRHRQQQKQQLTKGTSLPKLNLHLASVCVCVLQWQRAEALFAWLIAGKGREREGSGGEEDEEVCNGTLCVEGDYRERERAQLVFLLMITNSQSVSVFRV